MKFTPSSWETEKTEEVVYEHTNRHHYTYRVIKPNPERDRRDEYDEERDE